MSDLEKTALVTGGSRGIGRAISKAMARAGFQVFLTYVSRSDDALAVVSEIESEGGKATAFKLDISDSASIESFFAENISGKVHLSALVNNAGSTGDKLLVRMKDDEWDSIIDVNLRGPFLCLREASKLMVKQRVGRIVNIVSVVGQMGNAGQANYSAAKAGVIGLTKSAAKELAGRNITVNAVAPGFIDTDMTKNLSEDVQRAYMSQIPLKRFGSVEDVANAVVFLTSDEASYITGHVLAVNGGLYC